MVHAQLQRLQMEKSMLWEAKESCLCRRGTGKKIWDIHMVKDLDGKVPGWGYTESVLIDEGRVICTPGGKGGAIAALDAKSGKILWRSKEFTEPAQYSSPIVINHGVKRQ